MDAQTALDYGFADYVEGLERQPLDDTEETPEPEPEPEKEETEKEEDGLINKVLSLAGLKKRGEIIKAPVEDEQDKDALINSLTAEKQEMQMKLDNAEKSLEQKQLDFETKQTEFMNRLAALQDTIKQEVHNQLAALGYNADELPAPVAPAPKNNNEALTSLYKEMGFNF